MTAAPMQTYRAFYEKERIVIIDNPSIPEGSQLFITVVDSSPKSHAKRQREAFEEFWKGLDATPPLPPEFDEIIAQRVNIAREVEL